METPVRLFSPPPSPGAQTLAVDINAATRVVHTNLNRLITSRLPLALPSQSATPRLYFQGLDDFAQIYFAFEKAWGGISLGTDNNIALSRTTDSSPLLEQEQDEHGQEIKAYVCTLLPRGLWRSQRLKDDLQHLKSSFGFASDPGKVAQEHGEAIEARVHNRPHILLAYAWIMYMAIFSGGRWIREQLRQSEPDFWRATGLSDNVEGMETSSGFSFLCFDGEEDGEDIKMEFKKRLGDADEILTPGERRDILEEARHIFETCIGMVEDLDKRLKSPSNLPGSVKGLSPQVTPQTPATTQVPFDRKAWEEEIISSPKHALVALLAFVCTCGVWYYSHTLRSNESPA